MVSGGIASPVGAQSLRHFPNDRAHADGLCAGVMGGGAWWPVQTAAQGLLELARAFLVPETVRVRGLAGSTAVDTSAESAPVLGQGRGGEGGTACVDGIGAQVPHHFLLSLLCTDPARQCNGDFSHGFPPPMSFRLDRQAAPWPPTSRRCWLSRKTCTVLIVLNCSIFTFIPQPVVPLFWFARIDGPRCLSAATLGTTVFRGLGKRCSRQRNCGWRKDVHCTLARNWRIPSMESRTSWEVLVNSVGLWAALFRSLPHDSIKSESLAVIRS